MLDTDTLRTVDFILTIVGIALIHLKSTIDDSFASERALNYRRAHFTDLGGIGVHPLALTIC